MTLICPRLTDFHNILLPKKKQILLTLFGQRFVVMRAPFLLWKSPSQQDNALHFILIASFNHLSYLINHGNNAIAENILINASECSEVGLGFSKTGIGLKIGQKAAQKIYEVIKKELSQH